MPCIDSVFDLKTDADGVVAQLEYLSRALSSNLSSRHIDAAVVRTADIPPAGTRKAGPRNRLLIEGALLLTCQQKVPSEAYIRSGRDIGDVLGTTKDDALNRGKALDARRREAAAAALSQLPHS